MATVDVAGRLTPALAAVFVVLVAYSQLSGLADLFDGDTGLDFRGTLYEPAAKALDGDSPYLPPTQAAPVASEVPSVYTPVPILAAVPLTRLDSTGAYAVWVLLLVTAVSGSLFLVGVRDWRCHALALLCPPVLQGLYVGNLTLALMVPLALAWRWRRKGLKAGLALGAGIAIKPLLVPLIGWMLLTRRFLAVGVTFAASVILLVTSWAAIGFDGFRAYPALLDRIETVYGLGSYSLPSAFWQVAADRHVRHAICIGAILLLFSAAAACRRARSGDLAVFTLMLGACVVASPIVWPHYVALLLIPLGIVCPRPALLWFAPYALPLALGLEERTLRATAFTAFALFLTAAIATAARRPTARTAV